MTLLLPPSSCQVLQYKIYLLIGNCPLRRRFNSPPAVKRGKVKKNVDQDFNNVKPHD